MGHDLITLAGRRGDSESVGVSRGGAGRKGAKLNGEVIDLEREVIDGVVDILKTGFDNVTGVVKLTGGVLADGVG